MGKRIVIDIVFEGMSLNYDQGLSNVQELKKISVPDGTVHTLVSKYALRYSILKEMGGFADAKIIGETEAKDDKNKNKSNPVKQLRLESLITGEAFKYPEFVLFGFLITDPQIQRESPVKISNAISLTPFRNDILFYANQSFARRMAINKKETNMTPNPFNKEEHLALYTYNITIDYDELKKFGFYIDRKHLNKAFRPIFERTKDKSEEYQIIGNSPIEITNKDGKRIEDFKSFENNEKINVALTLQNANKENKEEITISIERVSKESNKKKSQTDGGSNKNDKEDNKKEDNLVYFISIKLPEKYISKIVEKFIKTVLNLKRTIQGRIEDISPKFAVIQVIKNEPTISYINKIQVSSEVKEKFIIGKDNDKNGKESNTVIRRLVKGLSIKLPITLKPEKKLCDYNEVIQQLFNKNNSSCLYIPYYDEIRNGNQNYYIIPTRFGTVELGFYGRTN